ncbi:MAG: acetylglutamate kinase [Sandaracinus sp.]|nr:acetylglutamate kinase [Sandaracinus sp.]
MAMQQLVDKAAVLHEALPYIRRFHGEILVVKYGGHAMIDADLRDSFARDVVLMKYVGFHPVVVHGGGPQIDATLAEFGVVSERLDGLRVTDDRTMKVVEMVLGARINQEIVSLIGNHGGRAVGLTGRDDHFVRAEKIDRMTTRSGKEVDPGRVGAVTHVNPDVVRRLALGGFIPVIAPIAVDADGNSLNVNADTVAGKVAEALQARKLVLMTDIDGVKDAEGEVLSSIAHNEAEQLTKDGVISGGMIPKVQCALDAIAGGVKKAHIIDGRTRHACILELFTDSGIGTMITGS